MIIGNEVVVTQAILWGLGIVVAYVYVGYPLLLAVLSIVKRPAHIRQAEITPAVSLIIAAYNEEKVIAQKIENTLALDYPRENLEIIVVSDGSTDNTNGIVRRYEDQGVKLIALEKNRGKSAAENAGMAVATGEIVVFSDATGIYSHDALRNLVRPFADAEVGCVTGLVEYGNVGTTAASDGEGVYWRYEVFLRLLESSVGNLAMASGSILACRRSLAQSLDEAVGEDFVTPMNAGMQGFRTLFAPRAVSHELIAETDQSLLKTKVRIINKDLLGLFLCRSILNPFRYPLYAWGLISHKLLRWLVPYFLIALFVVNVLLLDHPLFQIIMALQIVFYVIALVGYLCQRKGKPPRILGLPFSFCLVNLAALVGVARFAMGKKAGRWVPVR
ncbi:MAG: glycosyltransferase family 2 protein [Dehalococcoidia bacterium]|nr:glycosyltransferase family 2 protein [Dehalococcoidia bacterium]